tara:strand:- start:627 stop:956 length:330 start_codon:yes stop_codon:yes gene_type:complete
MNTISRIIRPLQRAFEATAKARVNSVLLGMGREKVEEYGYSFDALRLGPSAWPWRKTPQNGAEGKEASNHIRYLVAPGEGRSDDSGSGCKDIENPVRPGRTAAIDQDAA